MIISFYWIHILLRWRKISIEASKILNRIKNEYAMNDNIHFFTALEHIERKEYPSAINVYKKLKNKNTLKRKVNFIKE